LSTFRRVAQYIRHLPGLDRAEWLWAVLRKPYQRLLNAGGRGVEVLVGNAAAVRMPADFTGGTWEQFEPEAIAVFADWVRQHPGGLVLDVGSSIGIYSAVALFANPLVKVVAFDSDLSSLAAVRRLCQHAKGGRLRVVHGYITQTPNEVSSFDLAVATTEVALLRTGVSGEAGTTRFRCLTDQDANAVPSRRLDDLFESGVPDGRPILIKCDVEGAELLVLSGAENLLRRTYPYLLLSVHPMALPNYGHSKKEVELFLQRLGYRVRCLAVDHEEHWWCEFNSKHRSAA
jgi:FkbM family methyltransferase